MPRFIILLLIVFVSITAKGQFMSESQGKALDTLTKLKPLFQKTTNDSLFIAKHSDEKKYRYYFFVRGDQEEDIEETIYNTKPGEVAGPFKGENKSNFLFKVISFEGYSTRTRATLMYLKSDDNKQDTTALRKLAKKYAGLIAQGKNAKEQADKDKVRLISSDLKYYYEEQKDKEYYDLVFKGDKGKTFVVDSEHGPAILVITGKKEKVPYKVKLIAVVKKG
jgi:hypothetical protein